MSNFNIIGKWLLVVCALAVVPVPMLPTSFWYVWFMTLDQTWFCLVAALVIAALALYRKTPGAWVVLVLCATACVYGIYLHVSFTMFVLALSVIFTPARWLFAVMPTQAIALLVTGERMARDGKLGFPLAEHGDWFDAWDFFWWAHIHMALVLAYALAYAVAARWRVPGNGANS